MDILSAIWHYYKRFAEALPPAVYEFLINANFALFVPTALCFGAFYLGWRQPMLRWILLVAGVMLAISLPVEDWFDKRSLKPWLLPLWGLGLVYGPAPLAFLLEPRFEPQRRVRFKIQIVVGVLFVLNCIWAFFQ